MIFQKLPILRLIMVQFGTSTIIEHTIFPLKSRVLLLCGIILLFWGFPNLPPTEREIRFQDVYD